MIDGIVKIGVLIVAGIIVADIVTHPAGVTAASSGVNKLWSTSVGGLLGGSNKGGA